MKLATLEVTLTAGDLSLTLPRYQFNHALECMGFPVTPWGGMSADKLRVKSQMTRKALQRIPTEFTRDSEKVKVGKEIVVFEKLTIDDVRSIMSRLWMFAKRAEDNEVTF